MRMRRVDANNDWTFGKGLASYGRDDQAIQQNARARVLSWRNDCFFDTQNGVDWKGRLDVGQKEALESEIKSVLLQSYGIVGVSGVQVNFTGDLRHIEIIYQATTIFSRSFQTAIKRAAGTERANA